MYAERIIWKVNHCAIPNITRKSRLLVYLWRWGISVILTYQSLMSSVRQIFIFCGLSSAESVLFKSPYKLLKNIQLNMQWRKDDFLWLNWMFNVSVLLQHIFLKHAVYFVSAISEAQTSRIFGPATLLSNVKVYHL